MSMARYILGVGKKTTLLAVRGELGLHPLGFKALKNCLRSYVRYSSMDSNSLLGSAFNDSVKYNLDWFTSIAKLYKITDLPLPSDDSAVNSFLEILKYEYELHWTQQMNRDGEEEGNKL